MIIQTKNAETATIAKICGHRSNLGFRIDESRSYGEDDADNVIIHGDNLSVLAALKEIYEGRIRLVYIDPPYNNQEKYYHYLDRATHDNWLQQMETHLQILAPFLSEDGSIWISIDDTEVHYLKVVADSVFGRHNYLTTIIWQHRTTRENRKVFSNNNEFILVYARNARTFKEKRNMLPPSPELLRRYKNPDKDPRGPWQSVSANVQAGHGTQSQFYEFIAPNGRRHLPPNGRCWVFTRAKMEQEIAKNNIWLGRDGNGVPRIKHFLNQSKLGLTPHTLWTAEEVGTTDLAKKHMLRLLPNEQVFDTPKPESLLRRILQIATNPGDLVLDTFLGSATTAATAHKMGRRYIGVESGCHAVTHCVPRLSQVVNGESGGISEEVGWKGGGGFKFLRLISNKYRSSGLGATRNGAHQAEPSNGSHRVHTKDSASEHGARLASDLVRLEPIREV